MFHIPFKNEIRLLFYIIDEGFTNISTIIYNNIFYNKQQNLKIIEYFRQDTRYHNVLLKYNTIKFSNYKFVKYSYEIKRKNDKLKYNDVLCLTTFINYNKEEEFKKFINHYYNIGINLIVIYMTSCSENIKKMIYKYVKKGFMKIINDCYYNTTSKFIYGNSLHVLKHYDCFYRYLYCAKHILFVDQDELLVSKSGENLSKYAVVYFHAKLIVSYNTSYYYICPKSPWKYYIYNPYCVKSLDIHLVNIKRKCKSFTTDIKHGFILHRRLLYPWYFYKCNKTNIPIEN